MMNHPVGLLVGRERTFPDALIAAIARKDASVTAEYALLDVTSTDRPPPYSVLIDRISHEVTCYQPMLKLAVLAGSRVINNPFWRIADDKFFNTALAARLGVAVPQTFVLPSKSYGDDVTSDSLRNLRYPLDWKKMVEELGFPMYLKPHWGGGWNNVHCVRSMDELMATFDRTGRLTMIAQQGISWTQYVRCIVIGTEHVLPALWDPRLSHFERYVGASESMPGLTAELTAKVIHDSKVLCRALGYEMNTVEFAVSDGIPYAIDFMNSAPDFDISSLGEAHFGWTVDKMAEFVTNLTKLPPLPRDYRWDAMLR